MNSVKIERQFANELQNSEEFNERLDRMVVAREYLQYRISRDRKITVSPLEVKEIIARAKVKK